ncbi:class F sortase [Agromyces sp. C10]|uniref:class F sortase n=1 Tax=Agromyces sp. C10 TaxID=2935077 RepID=UPI00200A6171|nr:class F sortase [Agromyces sp. C10]MCK8610445.1 class F sortase [Agromyces sp. C10]
MKGTEAAARVIGSLVAVSAALGLLAGCVAAPSGGGAATVAPSATASPGADPASRPAAAAPPASVPEIPRQSASLEEQRRAQPPAPTRIEVPALGIDMAVRPVGLDAQGNMALFDDPAVAAWYQWGPAPASGSGSTVIAAHVDSLEYAVLPFAKLRDARPGTLVVVTDAAGTRHSFGVDSLEVIEKGVVDWDAAFDRSGASRLTLITCGGEFDYVNRTYLSNLVLTATPR